MDPPWSCFSCLLSLFLDLRAGSALSTAGVLPAGGMKQAGCEEKLVGRGRGVGHVKQAYSPPGLTCGRDNRRGVPCPRQGYSPPKERSKLVADGEWDARSKLTPRPDHFKAKKALSVHSNSKKAPANSKRRPQIQKKAPANSKKSAAPGADAAGRGKYSVVKSGFKSVGRILVSHPSSGALRVSRIPVSHPSSGTLCFRVW